MTTAEIITIGTELLLGETTDTNTRFIARTLRDLGVDLFRTQTIGDNVDRIAETVHNALNRADIVITTGGLGPTVDDPTRQALAQASGRGLEFHPELWDQISKRIAGYGRIPTENQKRQAYIPEGAIVIENPVGTAPAFIVESPQGVVITLPGVPSEMETLLLDAVVPWLQDRFNLRSVIKVRVLHVSGLGEGVIDEQIGDLEMLANPTIGLTAHSGVVDIRIAAKADKAVDAGKMIINVEEDLRKRLNGNIFGADEDTLEQVTLDAINKLGWSLACFEFQTDGSLRSRLAKTAHPAFLGGEVLGSSPENLVVPAKNIHEKFDSSVVMGLRITNDGTKHNIDILWDTPLGLEERHLTYGGHPKNANRWAVNMALDGLRRIMLELG
jgi:nicotinamide-nucleotide amidase